MQWIIYKLLKEEGSLNIQKKCDYWINERVDSLLNTKNIDIISEINYNNNSLILINEFIDYITKYKSITFYDFHQSYFFEKFENIVKFIYLNTESFSFEMENSIYLKYFFDLVFSIYKWEQYTIDDFNKIIDFWDDFDDIEINDWFYEELKLEINDFVINLNSLLETKKTS